MIQGFEYRDLGGGVNLGAAATAIQANQFELLENFYPQSTRIRRRGGIRRLTTQGAWDTNITAMFPLKRSDGSWVLLVAGATKFGKMGSDTISNLAGGLVIPNYAFPWTFFAYKDNAYALRRGAGNLIRVTPETALNAGIAPPAAAPTIAEGAAGDITAGVYRAVFTYYNRATALESNPSPESNALTLGASKKIDYTGLTASDNPFVDARRIYRTLAGQVGVYFFTHMIEDNVVTTYTGENVVVADMGRVVSFNNGVPPAALRGGVIFSERLFAHDGKDVFFSEYLLPECFGDESVFPVFPDDGHEIRALHAFGDRLIVGKTNKVHFIVGSGPSSFGLNTLSDRHGCMSHHSMQSAENLLFWYGSGKAVLRSDGTTVKEISDPRVKPILEAIDDADEEYIIGAVLPEKSWYVLSLPISGDNTTSTLVYNYRTDSWSVFTTPVGAPQFLSDAFTETFGHQLYSTHFDGHVYHFADGTYGFDDCSTLGGAITAAFRTKADDFGLPGAPKYFEEIWLLVPQVSGGTITLAALRDQLATAVSRSVTLDISKEWKAYKLAHSRNPGTVLQLQGTYTGETAIDIDQIHAEVGILRRGPGRLR